MRPRSQLVVSPRLGRARKWPGGGEDTIEDHDHRHREARPPALIRFLVDGPHGDMIHSTVPPGMVGRASTSGPSTSTGTSSRGEEEVSRRAIHRRESVTRLVPGVCIDIPLGTAFQNHCIGAALRVFTCTALPPSPGDEVVIDLSWAPRVSRARRSALGAAPGLILPSPHDALLREVSGACVVRARRSLRPLWNEPDERERSSGGSLVPLVAGRLAQEARPEGGRLVGRELLGTDRESCDP